MKNQFTKRLTITAMMTALAVVFGLLSFPLPFSFFPGHLTYDICDVFVLIVSFLFGPVYGALSSFSVAAIQSILPNGSGLYGFVMNIASTMSLVLPASLIYLKFKTKKGAALSLAVGSLCMILVMIGANYLIVPLFIKQATIEYINSIIVATTLFNVIKVAANSTITFLVYKHIGKLVKKI